MNIGTSLNRRRFVKLGAAAGLLIARSSVAEEVALSEADPTAVALGYAEDASNVETTRWTKKTDPDGDKQLCNNCSL